MQLVSISKLHSKKWKAHAADENNFPLCNKNKQGTPVIPGTVNLDCERCRDILIKRKIP